MDSSVLASSLPCATPVDNAVATRPAWTVPPVSCPGQRGFCMLFLRVRSTSVENRVGRMYHHGDTFVDTVECSQNIDPGTAIDGRERLWLHFALASEEFHSSASRTRGENPP